MIKKFLFVMLSVFAWTACSEETPQGGNQPGEVTELPVFEATVEKSQSRAVLSGTDVKWQSGDQIAVFPMTQSNTQYQLKGEGGNTSGVFEAVDPAANKQDGAALNCYGAVYPYHESFTAENTTSGLAFGVTIPSVQTYTPGTFDPKAWLMAAVSDNHQLGFKNVCSVLKLSLTGETKVKEISLTSNDGTNICGKGKVAFVKGDVPVWKSDADGSGTNVTLMCGEPVQLSSEPKDFYIALAPGTLAKGFTIRVTNDSGTTMIKKASAIFSFERRAIHDMDALTFATEIQQPNKTLKVGDVAFNMVHVQKGSFLMGAQNTDPDAANYDAEAGSDEAPVHEVILTEDYWIGETEVTQALWKQVMGAENNPSKCQGEQLPVETVSYEEIQQFITRLNEKNIVLDYEFALPTEAQWEFAARGGIKTHGYKYSGSNDISQVGASKEANIGQSSQGKSFAPNELGLYDMSGNVNEICADWKAGYTSGSQVDPKGPEESSLTGTPHRVFKGGSYYQDASWCRVAFRRGIQPSGESSKDNSCGFRLVMYPVPAKNIGNTEGFHEGEPVVWD